ncbi:unnamed protein product [Allacma fusca]|uniref:Mediator of RNA polymerase II transcription subunit 23 n=1 Tax=Allacma fusca TaxID=39272 RepID=A0A8J2MCV1_9HEXA|nr:unnamed protein product [Allacma fusca]
MTDEFPKIVKTEIQLLYVCHMIGPFLQRFNGEKPQMVCRLTVALYDLLEIVDKATPPDATFAYMDVFCDLLYHIKYMFTGDIVKNEVEAKIRNFRPALRLRLRFITHLSIEDISTSSNSSINTNINSVQS